MKTGWNLVVSYLFKVFYDSSKWNDLTKEEVKAEISLTFAIWPLMTAGPMIIEITPNSSVRIPDTTKPRATLDLSMVMVAAGDQRCKKTGKRRRAGTEAGRAGLVQRKAGSSWGSSYSRWSRPSSSSPLLCHIHANSCSQTSVRWLLPSLVKHMSTKLKLTIWSSGHLQQVPDWLSNAKKKAF